MMDGGTTEVTVKFLTDKEKEDRKKIIRVKEVENKTRASLSWMH